MTLRFPLASVCLVALAACTAGPGEVPGSATGPASNAAAQPVIQVAPSQPAGARTPLSTHDVADPPRPQRVRLSADDVRLYLAVMRAAAGRVRHPDPGDITATRSAAAWAALMDAAPALHTLPPAPLPEAVLEKSSNLDGHMADVQVASERGIDLARYRKIRDTIEALALPPHRDRACNGVEACRAGERSSRVAPSGNAGEPDPATAIDRRLLAPDLAEIRALAAIVRAPRQVAEAQ